MENTTLEYWKDIYIASNTPCIIANEHLDIVFAYKFDTADFPASLEQISYRLYGKNGDNRKLPEKSGNYGFIRFPNQLSPVFMSEIFDSASGSVCGYLMKFVTPSEVFHGRLVTDPNAMMIREKLMQIIAANSCIAGFLEDSENYSRLSDTDSILKGCYKILSCLSNSLQVSKFFDGRINCEIINISQSLEDILVFARRLLCLDESHSLTWELQKDVYLCCDEEHFHTVVANLVLNGFMYNISEEKKVHVTLKCSHDQIVFTVEDNGLGLPIDIIENPLLAKSYTPGNVDMIKDAEGLGLAYVSLFCQLINGSLNFLSARNEGTTAVIRMPCAQLEPGYRFRQKPPRFAEGIYSPVRVTLSKYENRD